MAGNRAGAMVALGTSFLLGATLLGSAGALPTASIALRAAAANHAMAGTAHAGSGRLVTASPTATAPTLTPAQRQALLDAQARSNRTGPRGAAGTTNPAPLGPQTAIHSALATTNLQIFRTKTIPASGIAGGYGYASFTQEPTTSQNGKNVFQTGNWYASYSHNNGGAWTALNPFTLFGSGFCCDQTSVYEPGRDRQFWSLQFGDHVTIANSAGANLATWCSYAFNPQNLGFPAGASFDYPAMAVGTNFVYYVSNVFLSNGAFTAAAVLRLPIDAMTSCSGFSYNYLTRSDSFTLKPVDGASDVMYFGSNWGQNNGAAFRVYYWAENSGSYGWVDNSINSFVFEYRNNGQNCASADGVVFNWCNYGDSRVTAGYVANGVVGFAFNANQDGGHPFPFVRRVYFRQSDLAYTTYSELWDGGNGIQYAAISPDPRGHLGISWSWGGGTGTTHYYPGSGLTLDDDISPSQPWAYSYWLYGQGNTCTYGGIYRWGDYTGVHPFNPATGVWVSSNYAMIGGNCGGTGNAVPYNIAFGRNRDIGSYNRWKGK
jgi:hypothetical protein